jgi:hypothetical protein
MAIISLYNIKQLHWLKWSFVMCWCGALEITFSSKDDKKIFFLPTDFFPGIFWHKRSRMSNNICFFYDFKRFSRLTDWCLREIWRKQNAQLISYSFTFNFHSNQDLSHFVRWSILNPHLLSRESYLKYFWKWR